MSLFEFKMPNDWKQKLFQGCEVATQKDGFRPLGRFNIRRPVAFDPTSSEIKKNIGTLGCRNDFKSPHGRFFRGVLYPKLILFRIRNPDI